MRPRYADVIRELKAMDFDKTAIAEKVEVDGMRFAVTGTSSLYR